MLGTQFLEPSRRNFLEPSRSLRQQLEELLLETSWLAEVTEFSQFQKYIQESRLKKFFSLDNTSLGVLAHLSGVVLVLVGLIQFSLVPSEFPVQISSLYFVSLTQGARCASVHASDFKQLACFCFLHASRLSGNTYSNIIHNQTNSRVHDQHHLEECIFTPCNFRAYTIQSRINMIACKEPKVDAVFFKLLRSRVTFLEY